MSNDLPHLPGDDLSPDEAEEARRLFAALQAFREDYPDMTVAQAAVLLLSASTAEPLSMTAIRGSLDVAASTATRAVLTLSTKANERPPRGEEAGLVAQSVDPKDRRWRFTYCTPGGYRTVRRALKAIRADDDERGPSEEI